MARRRTVRNQVAAVLRAFKERVTRLEHVPTAIGTELEPPGQDRLTPVERVFIQLACRPEGWPYKLIASNMGIAESTLHTHRRKVFRKLRVNSRAALLILALRSGLGGNDL